MLLRAKEVYYSWHERLVHIKRLDRYTIGGRIDEIFLSLLELIFQSSFAFDKFEKLSLVTRAIGKCDLLKFFLQLGWEQKILPHKLYGELTLKLDEVGRMLGGWKKSLIEKTPTKR